MGRGVRLTKAEEHLARVDRVMKRLIGELGPCTLRRKRVHDPFAALVRAVVAQMISSKAATTVYGRLEEILGEEVPSPGRVLEVGERRIRSAGLSRTKTRAILALAERVVDGSLPLDVAKGWKSERVSQALVDVPGIGPWTANMFLMFHLCRPNIFPERDLGVLEGMRRAYALDSRPTAAQARKRAETWAPYRSTAAWYMWRVLDGPVAL